MPHAVVVGSGIGGLISAHLLAMHGYTVTVLEQHYRPGGFLHRFFRNGIGYDTGFHYVGGARGDQLFGRVMKHVGIYDDLHMESMDPDGFDILKFPGFEFVVPVGVDAFRDRLLAAFPHETEGIHRYIAMHREAVLAYGLFNLDLTTPPESVLPWEERSLAEVLEACFDDLRLRAVLAGQGALYGVPPKDAPFGLHAIVTDHFLQGAWTVRGGGDKIAMALVRRLKARGGVVRLRSKVVAIDVEDHYARRVRTEDGTIYDADLVICNLHPRAVVDLVPPGTFRSAYVQRVTEAQPGVCHLGMYLRVEGDLSALGNRNLYAYDTWDPEEAAGCSTPARVPFYFLTAPGFRHPQGPPGTEQVVLGLIQTSYAEFKRWHGETPRSEAYTVFKQEIMEAGLRAIARDFPDWRIVRAEASTPLTTIDFTGSPFGATYGHYHSVRQMGRYRLPVRTKVRNLLQTGQCVGFPGICGATMSAYVACGEILGLPNLVEELKAQ